MGSVPSDWMRYIGSCELGFDRNINLPALFIEDVSHSLTVCNDYTWDLVNLIVASEDLP